MIIFYRNFPCIVTCIIQYEGATTAEEYRDFLIIYKNKQQIVMEHKLECSYHYDMCVDCDPKNHIEHMKKKGMFKNFIIVDDVY